MTLSICIPSIPVRLPALQVLLSRLEVQVSQLDNAYQVEVLAFTDNKRRTIGSKRQDLLDLARGEYIAFIDDDDIVSENYISKLVEATATGVDVITFNQQVFINGAGAFPLTFKLGHPVNEEPNLNGFRRPPWHVCCWKASIAKQCTFGDMNYGEDWVWAKQANVLASTSHHIDEYLCAYIYDDRTTAARLDND